ncbi:MAG: hypothetical protein RLN88_10955 [Ekhidna sp.]|uniref:hypothetical protein n=1 Tax=Ekhidna sp. TaxID=2608089 RepID=UPI0032EF9946
MKDYKKRIENLKARRQDIITKAFSVTEGFNKNLYGDTITYVLESMQPIAKEYTNNTYKACEKVQGHISLGLLEKGVEVEYRYQGSVPNNIHIKNYSDIDLLVIHQGFVTMQPPLPVPYPYKGDPIEDLKNMRKHIYKILDTVYSAATIDDTGSKALNISGGSLNRSIDIISSNWYDTVKYSETKDEDYRGVKILDWDKKNNSAQRILNYPFMHIYWINYKDGKVNGNAKKLIRFLKTLKADADDKIKVSSYDIASLVYRMDDSSLLVSESRTLQLLDNCHSYFEKIINDISYRDGLEVANSTRKIFCNDGVALSEFIKLKAELKDVIDDVVNDVRPLFESFDKAETYYGIN